MNKAITLLCVLLCCCFGASSLLVAQTSSSPKLLLRSGNKALPANTQQWAQQPDWLAGEAIQRTYVRMLQFSELPSPSVKSQMAAAGFELLQYFPHNSYLTAISAQANVNQLLQWKVRSVYRLQAADKLHPQLAQGNVPEYAWKGDRVEVLLTRYASLAAPSWTQEQLQRKGWQVIQSPEQADFSIVQLPLEQVWDLAALPFVAYVEPNPGPGEPEDVRGRSLHRSNAINSDFSGGKKYDGSGVSVQVRDDGAIGPHIDYQGRLDLGYVGGPGGTHGDGVGGIFAGAGNLNPDNAGMATGAYVYATNYDATFTDVTLFLHQQLDMLVTNSSYSNGCNAGYTTITERVDEQTFENPTLLHVFSAGNSNNQDCGYGAGNQWGNITGGHKMGKNVIATANLFADDGLVNSSSRGPAHDGRLKPDIAAHGQGQISTAPNNGYLTFGGTSGAAPGIAGVSAQLIHAYRELNTGETPESALIKASMMNTAFDLGNVGPDFRYGWGRIDANRALNTLEENRYFLDSIGQAGQNTHSISIPADVKEVRVMVYWSEPPAAPGAGKALINNLDMQLTTPGGVMNLPLILDPTPNPANLNLPAVPGVDTLNNVEQVRILDPAAGTYTLNVLGTSVPEGPQRYYVVYEFLTEEIALTYPIGGEGFVPGSFERLRWDSYGTSGNFTLEYTTDDGANWQNLVSNLTGSSRQFNWLVPAELSGEVRVRVIRGANQDESDANFSIIGQPSNLQVLQVCPNTTTFSWDAVPGATGYDVFLLGAQKMDSVMSVAASPNPEATIVGINPSASEWIAVRATGPNAAVGKRSLAIERGPGRLNCDIDNDLELTFLETEGPDFLRACFGENVTITVGVENAGNIPLSGFELNYQLGNQPVITETYSANLIGLAQDTFTFSTLMNTQFGGINALKAWVSWVNDPEPYNDSSQQEVVIYPGETLPLPIVEDFEGFTACSSDPNCGEEICDLNQAWVNLPNGYGDDVDWRVFSGGTPSAFTGPITDHKPGTATGQYLYLESTGDCGSLGAYLLSPCLDLTTASQPEMRFWYHMYGAGMGNLFVEVYRGNGVVQNFVIPPIFGNQGNLWQEAVVDLSPYVGELITVRIRGLISGVGETGDLAIDDFVVYDRTAAPVADFTSDRQRVCIDAPIQLTDLSLGQPNSWRWSISPDAGEFLPGSSPFQPNPQIRFPLAGDYEIKLVVSNATGSDSVIRTQYLSVVPGESMDWTENFEVPIFPPTYWELHNDVQVLTWFQDEEINLGGALSQVSRMPFYSYGAAGTKDYLVSPPLDLRGAAQPWLYFDLAYGGDVDILEIEISTDCGESFSQMIYQEAGPDLATFAGAPASGIWSPASAADWRTDSIDLSPYVGNEVVLRFVGINSADFLLSNDLFLDNIRISERGLAAPSANFGADVQIICEEQTVVFTDLSTGTVDTYLWDFGPGAVPATANTAGPHPVQFTQAGIQSVSLITSNGGGSTDWQGAVEIEPLPLSDYSVSIAGLQYSFTNISAEADSFQWDFGDGNTSTEENPVHTYASYGFY
ncbi:MAG: S8 family serine peptidase, partial [Bacteroidota bacterium]